MGLARRIADYAKGIFTDSSGNVGIGTNSPNGKLDVAGTINVSSFNGNTGGVITTSGEASLSNKLVIHGSRGDGGIIFQTNSAERARIDASGRFGLNAPPAAWIGNEQFYLKGDNSAGQFVAAIAHSASSPSGGCVQFLNFSSAAPNNTSNSYLICNDNSGVSKLNIYSNGTVSNRTGTYNSLSDLKLKENVVDATPKLDKLMQVQVRNYNLIGDELKQIGFVAQELEQVFPGLVEDVPDFDKEQQLTGEYTKMVKTSVLIPILVKAIQELKAEVDSLKAQPSTVSTVD